MSMKRKKRRDDKVIHVVFGPGGGRVQTKQRRAPSEKRDAAAPRRESVEYRILSARRLSTYTPWRSAGHCLGIIEVRTLAV